MLYFFCDEDPAELDSGRFRFAVVCLQQHGYNNGIQRFRDLRVGGGSFLDRLATALQQAEGFSVASEVNLDPSLVAPRATCQTGDIPRMSRRDFAWSTSLIMTIAVAMRTTLERSWAYRTVDVYYDSKSLTEEHRASVDLVIQKRMKMYASEYLELYHKSLGESVVIRRMQEVPKSTGGDPDKFQLGVWLADRIVRRFNEVKMRSGDRVFETQDLTDLVVSTLDRL